MIEKDYILRQIHKILESLVLKFSKIQSGSISYNPEEFNDIYLKYLGQDRKFFVDRNIKEITDYMLQNYSKEEAFARMSVLAELLAGESELLKEKYLLEKAINILQYANNNHSEIFDTSRNTRLSELKKIFNE